MRRYSSTGRQRAQPLGSRRRRVSDRTTKPARDALPAGSSGPGAAAARSRIRARARRPPRWHSRPRTATCPGPASPPLRTPHTKRSARRPWRSRAEPSRAEPSPALPDPPRRRGAFSTTPARMAAVRPPRRELLQAPRRPLRSALRGRPAARHSPVRCPRAEGPGVPLGSAPARPPAAGRAHPVCGWAPPDWPPGGGARGRAPQEWRRGGGEAGLLQVRRGAALGRGQEAGPGSRRGRAAHRACAAVPRL